MHKTTLACQPNLLCTFLSSPLQDRSLGDSLADMWRITLGQWWPGSLVRSSRAFWHCAGSASRVKSLSWLSVRFGVSDRPPHDPKQTIDSSIVYRLLFGRTCHVTWLLLSQYMSRPVASGYPARHVLGLLLHSDIDRGPNCRSPSYDGCGRRWEKVNQFSWRTDLERGMSFARVSGSCAAVDYDCSKAKERYFHMSRLKRVRRQ